MTHAPALPRRACLCVPGSDLHKIEKAAASGADEVIIDLEDAVVAVAKGDARATALHALRHVDWGGAAVAVRVNAPRTPWCHADLVALADAPLRLRSVVVPKVESSGDLAFVDRLLDGALDEVTALLLSCVDPTLLGGRRAAAYEVPPRATKSAR